jgi:hypothetical protein
MEPGQVIGLIVAIAVGIWAGNDAQSRGMSGWWGFGVACIMIIFLPWYLIVRKPKLDSKYHK